MATTTKQRISWVLGGLAVLFLVFDGTIKLFNIAPVVEASAKLGLPDHVAIYIGLLELALLAVYLVPRTAVLGALLWTGYLGGAIAIQVRAEQGWFPIVFPTFIALLLWSSLDLRDSRVRALIS